MAVTFPGQINLVRTVSYNIVKERMIYFSLYLHNKTLIQCMSYFTFAMFQTCMTGLFACDAKT